MVAERIPADFSLALRQATTRVLLLDYDGTLAPFVTNRHQATPYPGVVPRLEAIMRRGTTRLVLVSGRAASEVLQLLDLAPPPEVWGGHGAERYRPDGTHVAQPLSSVAASALQRARQLGKQQGWDGQLEVKQHSVALHWRGLAAAEAQRARVELLRGWQELAAPAGLEVREFDGGLELRSMALTKARAVAAVLAEAGPDAACAYLGDDDTDEDAFRAMAGRGLAVLVRPAWRETAAGLWLQPPGELLEFLDWWLAAAGD